MGDGYTAGQQDQFLEDATKKARGMLTWSPYREYSDRINIYAVQAVSNESGIGVYGGKSGYIFSCQSIWKGSRIYQCGDERAKALRTNWKKIIWMKAQMLNDSYTLYNDTEAMVHQ